MTQHKMTSLETARAAWGDDLPEWIEAMALECARTSQSAVAREIDRSPAVVSSILNRRYQADMRNIQERFRGVFQDGKVACPALGEIPSHKCQDWRAKASAPFVVTNSHRSRMRQACKVCPRHLNKETEE